MTDLLALQARKRELTLKRKYAEQRYVDSFIYQQELMDIMVKCDNELHVIEFDLQKTERERSDREWAVKKILDSI